MSTSTSGLAGHPVDDDEWQTHNHEDKAQASEAGSLWKWKKSNDHIDYVHQNNFVTFPTMERTEAEPESWVWKEEAPAPLEQSARRRSQEG